MTAAKRDLLHGAFPRRSWLAAGALLLLIVAAWLGWRTLFSGRDPVWERIQASGVWRVGVDPSFPPFEGADALTGQPAGLDVDLANAIAARWGVQVEWVAIGFDQLVDAVAAQRVDAAISALPVLEHRARDVAFSAPYVEAGVVLAVPRASTVAAAGDLAGRRIAAEWGSAGDAQARLLGQPSTSAPQLVLRPSADEALAAVLAGEADAAAVDAISLALFERGAGRLRIVGEPLQRDPYVIYTPVGAPRLLGAVNAALTALRADGTLANIKTRWLGADAP